MEIPNTRKSGVAFSGGGVRSAALCSGVLRRLLHKGVSIDFLNCLSGGGYTGASYMDWKFHHGKKDDPTWHKEYFEHLRRNINNLCNCSNPCHGLVDTVLFVSFVLFFSLGLGAIKSVSFIIPTSYFVDYCIGDLLRQQFDCGESNVNKTVAGIPKEKLVEVCVPMSGPKMAELVSLFLIMFGVFALSYYLSTLPWHRTFKYFLQLLSKVAGYALSMAFVPWFIELFSNFTPEWAGYFIIAFVSIVFVLFPPLRKLAIIGLLILVYAYFVTWRVFKRPFFGFHYSHERYWIMMWISGILLWICPYVGIIRIYATHLYIERKLYKAYLYPHTTGACCSPLCSSLCQSNEGSGNKLCTLADLHDMKPELQCNVTANKWRKSKAAKEKDYEVLTLSPSVIERIDRGQEEKEFGYKGFVQPKDIRLSTAMATSAAAISYDVGDLENPKDSYRDIRAILGISAGNYLVAQPGLINSWISWVRKKYLDTSWKEIMSAISITRHEHTQNN